MKKSFIFLGLLALGFANAQEVGHDGKVGINTETPKATLEVKAYSKGDKKEGLLIPRLAKETVISMTGTYRAEIEESTLLYVTDEVAESDNATFKGTGKGFYYFDRQVDRWVKVGSGTAAATPTTLDMNKATGKVQKITAPVAANSIDPTTSFVIVTQGGAETVTLPAPPNNGEEVRFLYINNQTGSDITYQGNYQPRGHGKQAPGSGFTLIGYKNVWYVGGGLY